MTKIYQFKVKDYTTILYGHRYEEGYFVQRGDGTKHKYHDCRIEWVKEIEVEE